MMSGAPTILEAAFIENDGMTEKTPGLGHEPVLKDEVLKFLHPQLGQCFIDCTVGLGGHAASILERIGPSGKLIAIDRDPDAILASREKLRRFGDAVVWVCDNFRHIARIRIRLGLESIHGILVDCGISSVQMGDAKRGFSFQEEGPLDMRMDPSQPYKLSDFLKQASEEELARTIWEWGEERYARRIARAIKRASRSLRSTRDLAEIIRCSVPLSYRYGRIDAATRTFQALRIRVNDEIASLKEGIENGIRCLLPGGRLAVISFHSLEDRCVKGLFHQAAKDHLGFPLTKKPVRPSMEEVARNPRSRSARLRVFERGAGG